MKIVENAKKELSALRGRLNGDCLDETTFGNVGAVSKEGQPGFENQSGDEIRIELQGQIDLLIGLAKLHFRQIIFGGVVVLLLR